MKSNKKYRIAVVGCGQIGALYDSEPKRQKPASHAGAAMANSRTELAALIDPNAANLRAASKLFPGAATYASLAECLRNDAIDIVVVATPPETRLSVITEAANAGVRMFICEKPLAYTLGEAKKIQQFAEKNKLTIVVNYPRRFSPLYTKLKSDIAKNTLGTIQQVTCYYSNGLYANGGHIVDALLFLLGEKIVSAMGVEHQVKSAAPKGDSNIDALLLTEKGATISLQSFDQEAYGIHDIRIFGTKASALLTAYGIELLYAQPRESQFAMVRQLAAGKKFSASLSATKDALAEVIYSFEHHAESRSAVSNSIEVTRVLDAIAASAKKGSKRIVIKK